MAAKDAVSIRAREYYYLQYIIIRFRLLMKSIFIKTRVRAPSIYFCRIGKNLCISQST
jgi:hypothetical protein